jgi:hypothetical protein
VTGVVAACPCGEVYELRPEYAGRLLECPVCGRRLRAGGAPRRPPPPDLDPAFDRDRFLLRQRVLTIASKYEVCSDDGARVLYVERPTYPVRTLLAYLLATIAALVVATGVYPAVRDASEIVGALLTLAGSVLTAATFVVVSMSARPLRHVTFYRDETRHESVLRIRQDQRLALFVRSYTVLTAGGTMLARLRKNYLHNVFRKRWYVEMPPGRRLAMAIEDSIVLSLLRRVLVGSLFGILRTNFVLIHLAGPAAGTTFGEFNRKFTLLDRYVLDLEGDPERHFDRRIALALCVMLDTGERR